MTPRQLPSLAVAEAEKKAFTEADVHSKLFEPDMRLLGYPRRTSNQADGGRDLQSRITLDPFRQRRGLRGILA